MTLLGERWYPLRLRCPGALAPVRSRGAGENERPGRFNSCGIAEAKGGARPTIARALWDAASHVERGKPRSPGLKAVGSPCRHVLALSSHPQIPSSHKAVGGRVGPEKRKYGRIIFVDNRRKECVKWRHKLLRPRMMRRYRPTFNVNAKKCQLTCVTPCTPTAQLA
jgi:hypothetical protein